MDSLDQKRRRFLEDILKNFFNDEDTKAFKKFFNISSKITNLNAINKKQINLDINDLFKILAQLDLLITFAQSKLSLNKYLEFLLLIGKFTITVGEVSASIYIHEKILNETKNKPELINFCATAALTLAEIYSRQASWKTSFSYIKQANTLFKKAKDSKGSANCENLLGTIYGDFGELKKSKEHFEKSLVFLENDADSALKGTLEINLGILNNILGEFEAALSYYRRALVLFEGMHNLKRIVEIRHNMGMLYTKMNQLNMAIKEFDRCISAALQTGYLPSIGLAYLSKAYIYTRQNDFLVAEAFADKSLEICNKTNDKLSIADIYKIKGIIYKNLKKYQTAEDYCLTSLRINKELIPGTHTYEYFAPESMDIMINQLKLSFQEKCDFTITFCGILQKNIPQENFLWIRLQEIIETYAIYRTLLSLFDLNNSGNTLEPPMIDFENDIRIYNGRCSFFKFKRTF